MMPTTLLIGIGLFMITFLIIRMPAFLFRFVSTSTVRLVIGLLLLVLLNVVGNQFGLFVPINLLTIVITSILGFFGILSLVAIQLFILV